MTTFDSHKNFAISTVRTAPSPAVSGGSLTVAVGEGSLFPAAPFNVVIYPANESPSVSNAEVARCTDVTGDVLTLSRAQEGSTARVVQAGDVVVLAITAKALTDVEGAVVPTGGAISYRGITSPSADWLVEDGSAVSRTVYDDLFDVQGETYGAGDGLTTFNLMDARGRVIVFLGTNPSVSSRNLSDGQAVANRRPYHRTTNAATLPNHVHAPATGNILFKDGSGGDRVWSGAGPTTTDGASSATGNPTTNPAIGGSIGTNNANDVLDAPSFVVAGVSIVKT